MGSLDSVPVLLGEVPFLQGALWTPVLYFLRGSMSSPDPLQVLRLPPPSLIQASARRRSPPITSPHLHLRARRAVMHHPTPLINNSCCLLLAEVETKVSGPERTMKTAAADGRRCHQEEAKAIKCAAFEGFVGPPA